MIVNKVKYKSRSISAEKKAKFERFNATELGT